MRQDRHDGSDYVEFVHARNHRRMAAIIEKLVRTANATEFVTVRIPDHREKPP